MSRISKNTLRMYDVLYDDRKKMLKMLKNLTIKARRKLAEARFDFESTRQNWEIEGFLTNKK